MSGRDNQIYKDSLEFHAKGRKGKIAIDPIKPLINQRSLALAYSPGVAAPCLEIKRDPNLAYEYTSKGNFVAVVSNGTAVLGLGNLGALASKPVMEGKSVLFKRFADIDSIDIEVNTEDPDEFVNTVKNIALTWGGINLEDIKAPECFIIEKKLNALVDIPVFHDDQHGTAIVVVAGMINAAFLTGRKFEEIKVVVNGAGAAAIACIELLKAVGLKSENAILCDTKGVIYDGRVDGMNEWKAKHAVKTDKRTLADAVAGADVFLGLSVKGAMTKEMVKSMAQNPIIFAMANPDPEITPDEVKEVRSDAIIATGRSDYNNQVNNVMCFPYIFRGALDVRAKDINLEMKIAAANAIAKLAREEVTEEISLAYSGKKTKFGPEYIIPVPFDSRLIQQVPAAVAKAAMDSGVAGKAIGNFFEYKRELLARLSTVCQMSNILFSKVRNRNKTLVFADDGDAMIKAAKEWCQNGYGQAKIIANADKVSRFVDLKEIKIEVIDPRNINDKYLAVLNDTIRKKGLKEVDLNREDLTNDLALLGSLILESGEADGMVAGLSKGYISTLNSVTKVIDRAENSPLFAISALSRRDKLLFLADTAVNEYPNPEMLADIAIKAAAKVKELGYEAIVAFISSSTFGNPNFSGSKVVKDAISILNNKEVDFEYDGELAANVAINENLLKRYDSCKLSKAANILIMPELHSAHIASKLLQEFGGASLTGPILCGLKKSVQIVQMDSSVSEILNSAAISAVII